MKNYIEELNFFIKKWYFTLFLIILAIVGFGFTTGHLAINIDTMNGDLYHGSGKVMIAAGRFGMSFWANLFGDAVYQIENSFAVGVIGVTMLLLAAVNFCILFRRASSDSISFASYMVFAGIFVSYPLINEIWEYNGMELIIGGGYLFVSFSMLLIDDQLKANKVSIPKCLAVLFMLTIICASYESLVVVYIVSVLAVLYLKESHNKDWKRHISEGALYAGAIVCGIVMRLIVHRILLLVMGISATQNGETQIYWLTDPFFQTVKKTIGSIFFKHFLFGPFYFPVLLFAVCTLVIIICAIIHICKKKVFSGLLLLGMFFSTELLSLIQGNASPYRTCQSFAIVVAFALMLVANKLRWRNFVPVALCLVCLLQSINLNYYFTLNQIRYEQEVTVIHRIAGDLQSEHDMSKPIMFVGHYQLTDYIKSQKQGALNNSMAQSVLPMLEDYLDITPERIRRPTSNVNSVLAWSAGSEEIMEKTFAYFGYELTMTDNRDRGMETYEELNSQNTIPCYPNNGYIVELDDLIIVKLAEE